MQRIYKKLFYDLDKAKRFGQEVDSISNKVTVSAGKSEYFLFSGQVARPEYAAVGEFYYIEKEKVSNKRDVYYVCYDVPLHKRAARADVLRATQQAKEYLDQKYSELGPTLGIAK